MSRLNIERQIEHEPKRLEYAINQLKKRNIEITSQDDKKVVFIFRGEKVTLFPYSGWFTGKSVNDGRGIQNLLKQLGK